MNTDFLLVSFVLHLLLGSVGSTTLAGAGYLASDPVVRNFLILTGLGQKARSQADVLYNLSGFRRVSDQGSGRRHASTFTHRVVEVNKSDFSRRQLALDAEKDRVKRDHPSHEERDYLEKLFGVMDKMDRTTCILRMLCEIGGDPTIFGSIGAKVDNYLRSVPAVTWNSSTYPYLEAYGLGRAEGIGTCFQNYHSCSYDLKNVARLLEVFSKIIPSST